VNDLLVILATLVFFAVSVAYAHGCDALGRDRP
jgi:hypothetical protein